MENSGRDGGVSSTRRTSKRLEYEALTGLPILDICDKSKKKKEVNSIYSIPFYVLKSLSYHYWKQFILDYLQAACSLLMKYNISKQISPHLKNNLWLICYLYVIHLLKIEFHNI